MDRFWKAYLGTGVLVVAVYLLFPAGVPRDLIYGVVGLSSVAAIAAGVLRHRPARPWAWWAMAAGQLMWVCADTLFSWYQDVAHIDPYPSPADGVYLLAYPLVSAGFVVLVRARQQRRDVAGLIDSGVLTAGLALVSWVVLGAPIARAGDLSFPEKVVGVAYPAADILLLAVLMRLVIVPGGRTPAFRLLTGAALALLVADSVFAVLIATSGYESSAVDLVWLASYVLWGSAALHPSMRELTETHVHKPVPFTRRRLTALTVAVLLAPVILIVQLISGTAPSVWAVALASIVLFSLVVMRMNAAIQQVVVSTEQRVRLQNDLAYQAAHDSLTELANRARALELIEAGLHRGQRSGGPVGLLFIDLDHFKAVNDTHGHRAGDDVLRETAARMKRLIRAGDSIGRLGGDEFVVLIESVSTERDLIDLAERLVASISAPMRAGGHDVVIGASIGVAVNRDGGTDAAGLLHEADAAAYRAKSAGRGRVEVFDEALRRQLDERAELEEAIREGLAAGEFLLHYQPVVRVDGATLEGYEALVRWNRPGHGLTMPDSFIPTAEKSTLICHLGRWVLGEATLRFARWLQTRTMDDEEPGSPVTIAVNISGRHLAAASIVTDVKNALRAAQLPPELLVLEITETVLIDEPAAAPHLRALRELGVKISIDDFGTGYTSIGQLQFLNADTLKIDKSLVGSQRPGAAELVELVVRAAHAFGLSVIAEGIEHEEQVLALQRVGCDSAQGYLFARPQESLDVGRDLVPRRSPPSAGERPGD
ncbi:EAL domain-containing protein [Kineosporia sp. J2-2]|uniref:EAL domain-containing protein n=1 Tax=Kineosporia corallincola TaxID=2835133 RepID=A0ABS5TD86_9ACTN|nr:EAL domain-containing protein [Kineosporia corallincola]MBT0769053.1 EAL domain-containing protein [Kineosporia corallincola]